MKVVKKFKMFDAHQFQQGFGKI